MNIGATRPEEIGGYFAWGETNPKIVYNRNTYKWMADGERTWTHICKYTLADKQYDGCWYDDNKNFKGDGVQKLTSVDDAASVNFGGDWRIPTYDEWQELRDKCRWKFGNFNGICGSLVTGPNGNSIFLPAAGYRCGHDCYFAGFTGYYWTSGLNPSSTYYARSFILDSSILCASYYRYYGLSVRAVASGS